MKQTIIKLIKIMQSLDNYSDSELFDDEFLNQEVSDLADIIFRLVGIPKFQGFYEDACLEILWDDNKKSASKIYQELLEIKEQDEKNQEI